MSMDFTVHRWSELDEKQRSDALRRPAASQDSTIQEATETIVDTVRADGDEALRRFSKRFDGAEIVQFKVAENDIAAASDALSEEQSAAIDLAIDNVRIFHEQQLSTPTRLETMPGVVCERYSHAIDTVGLYVPAGSAPLPSAAIMLGVPAVIAGCTNISLCTPPRPDGTAHPAVLSAAFRSGITDIYTVGGAQAIAAMAYGTESIPQVRKIFGPGNVWVTSAKSIVAADLEGAAIDMPAGPSEVLVIGDSAASAEFVAADLLSQAEHGDDSQVVFVTTDETLLQEVLTELEEQLWDLKRAATILAALRHAVTIIADSIETAIEISNRYAPEHLILQVNNPRDALRSVRNAGSVFIGPWSPESVGDYCSGTNHVLPTYGFATTYSGLSVDQFMRKMTVQELTRKGLKGLARATICLAELEGLDAHAAAVRRRLGMRR